MVCVRRLCTSHLFPPPSLPRRLWGFYGAIVGKIRLIYTLKMTHTLGTLHHIDWFIINNNIWRSLFLGIYRIIILFLTVKGTVAPPGQISGNLKNNPNSIHVDFDVYQCYFDYCNPPENLEEVAPTDTRPSSTIQWSDTTSWEYNSMEDYKQSVRGSGNVLPANDDSIAILKGRQH